MTPERAVEVLRCMHNSLASWVEALEAVPDKGPETRHLLGSMTQSLYTLDQLIEWEIDPG